MIKLKRLPGGGFDVDLAGSQDAEGTVATVVYALLLTDQRAPVEREPDAFARRGWWADPQAGSGLWHVRRQALDGAARDETVRMVRERLQQEPAFAELVVADASPPGSVSDLQMAISGQHNGRQFLMNVTLNADPIHTPNL